MIKTDKPLVQWEKDRSVVIDTKEQYNKVHFYNENSTEAPVVLPRKDNTAPIPNILLQENLPIIVRLVYATGNEERYIEFAVLDVEENTKPADYIYTETEVLSYITLEKRIEELEKGGGSGTGMTEEERKQLNKNTEDINELKTRVKTVEDDIGEIDKALDGIIEIQNSLIGGGSE